MKSILSLSLVAFAFAAPLQAQAGQLDPQVEIAWNRYYQHAELHELMVRMQRQWPGFIRIEEIGRSFEGRPMRVLTLTNFATGPAESKAAMWVDGNVHGNEVQGGEAALYMVWWLLERYETNERAKALLDTKAFYVLPSQNPDGRDHWFQKANTMSSSRTGKKPTDNDRDGLFDEDDYDDLDGDGEIVSMRKRVPMGTGTHMLDPADPRILLPARGEDRKRADYVMLGREGIDNDSDGRINEDGAGGYDMNRNWPSDWQPNHIQFGAGDYPLSYPETKAVADFLLAHPNVAAVQSFHNSGGMLLRGPGIEALPYPSTDVAVYDAIGEEGELILPFYRYMILWKDLYEVHGGFVNWAYEGLGAFAFTNELWASPQYFGGTREQPGGSWWSNSQQNQLDFNDSVLLGDAYVDWHPYDHPLYGEVEIGGFKREHGRVAPSFMIEEMLHRNALFCIRHAEEMPEISLAAPKVEDLGEGLFRVTAHVENARLIPTRSRMAADKQMGTPDRATLTGPDLEVLAGGVAADRWRPERVSLHDGDPATLRLERGVPSQGRTTLVWIVRGSGSARIDYAAEKAADVASSFTLE